MRIVYLHQYFKTPAMAGGIRSYEVARRLVAKGHQVTMITSRTDMRNAGASGWISTNEDGIDVLWCTVPYSNRMNYKQRVMAFLEYAYKAAFKAASIPADLVFATSTPLTVAIPAVYAKRRRRIPMVFEVRDLWPEAAIAIGALKNPLTIKVARRLERQAYRHATRVIALSPGMKEGVVKSGYPEERVSVIPNASDIDLFSGHSEAARQLRQRHTWLLDRPLVLYAGTLGRVNGVDYMVALAKNSLAVDPEVCFVIIGDGREKESIRSLAATAGVLDRNLFMLPRMPKTDVAVWMAAADIALSLVVPIPELWKNSANKFFDALAAGIPIAINYGGWQADIIAQSGAGLLLHPTDHAAAATTLLKAIRDEQWKRSAGKKAIELAANEFCRERLVDRLETVLLQALDEGPVVVPM